MKARDVVTLFRRSAKEWVEDKAPKQAAALAYYLLFAMGPLLLVCIAVAALLVGHQTAQQAMLVPFQRLTGEAGAKAMNDILAGAGPRGSSIVALVVGTVALIFGAMGVFNQLKEGLNTVFEVEKKPRQGFWNQLRGALRDNALSFAGVMGVAFLLAATLVLSAAFAAVATWLNGSVAGGAILGLVLEGLLAVLILTLVFALLFKLVPDVRIAWRDTWVGAFVTAILFVAGQAALGVYLGHTAFASRYGAGGAVLLLLVWLYYSSMILIFGAELTQVYANLFGRHVEPGPRARPIQEAIQEDHRAPDTEGLDEGGKAKSGRSRHAL